ncbi:GAF domain-containing protein [Pontivivens insulae]|nr:GAF domain-containing protein [Pontivivens insulae]
MDSPPEEAFDRAVRLATRLLGTPVGLVSLVDGQRQFFKAQTGLPEPTATARETPLTHSFCQHVVTSDAPLTVHDAREDPLVQDNLAIRDLGVIAYLGVPLHAPDGQVLGSFCAIQSEPRDWTEAELATLTDIAAGIETEIKLRDEVVRNADLAERATAAEERFRLALHAGQVGTYDFDPRTQQTRWDQELYAIWGVATDVADVFAAVQQSIHADDLQMWEADVAASLDPDGTGQHDIEMRIYRPDSGEMRWMHAMGQASFENGIPVRLIGTVRDITAQKEAAEREKLLAHELNHRVKNLFAVVSGMISMTARNSTTPDDMATALRGRVQALSAAHALIQPAISGEQLETSQVTLQTLTAALLEPHMRGADAVTLAGPALPLEPGTASSLALVLHELATNAAKYGALSASEGKLDVTWALSDDDGAEVLTFQWGENGGPPVAAAPTAKGFGSKLIEMTVNAQMRGRLKSDWATSGVHHTLTIPFDYLQKG